MYRQLAHLVRQNSAIAFISQPPRRPGLHFRRKHLRRDITDGATREKRSTRRRARRSEIAWAITNIVTSRHNSLA